MSTYNIHDAKSQLSKLIEEAQSGREVIIARAGKPVAILGPLPAARSPRIRGLLKGQVSLEAAFDADLPSEIRDAFESKT